MTNTRIKLSQHLDQKTFGSLSFPTTFNLILIYFLHFLNQQLIMVKRSEYIRLVKQRTIIIKRRADKLKMVSCCHSQNVSRQKSRCITFWSRDCGTLWILTSILRNSTEQNWEKPRHAPSIAPCKTSTMQCMWMLDKFISRCITFLVLLCFSFDN